MDRKIRKEMHKRRLGNIKIATHAYIYLLTHSNKEDAVLYAQELVKCRSLPFKERDGGPRDDQCARAGIRGCFGSKQSHRTREPLVSIARVCWAVMLCLVGDSPQKQQQSACFADER